MVEGRGSCTRGFSRPSTAAFRILDPSVLARVLLERWVLGPLGDALSGVVDLETDGARPRPRREPASTSSAAGTRAIHLRETRRFLDVGARDRHVAPQHAASRHGRVSSAPRSLEGVTGATFRLRQGLELKAVALGEGDDAAREVDAIGWHGPFESRGQTALALVRCGR